MLTSSNPVSAIIARRFFVSARHDEQAAIALVLGGYFVGEPHGSQLDAARHAASVALFPARYAADFDRCYSVIEDLTPAEREVLRRWRNYERRAQLAVDALAALDAEILELSEKGEAPSHEQCVERNALCKERDFWQERAGSPLEYPLEVDGYSDPAPMAESELETLISSQKEDQKDWKRCSKNAR